MWKKTEVEESQIQSQSEPVIMPHTNPVPQPVKEQAMIGKTIHIKGDLMGEEDLLIEGQVDGKVLVQQHNVTVGKNGHVNADIYGSTISIEGNVEGNLFGENQLIIKKTGKVRGNIVAPRVILEDGSNFKGSIDMNPKVARDKPAVELSPSSDKLFDRPMNPVPVAPAIDIADM